MASDPVQVVFRNQCRQPVRVVLNGYSVSGVATRLYVGVVTGMSGVFTVSGYASYGCSAYAESMTTPLLTTNSSVTVVFQSQAGVQW